MPRPQPRVLLREVAEMMRVEHKDTPEEVFYRKVADYLNLSAATWTLLSEMHQRTVLAVAVAYLDGP